MNTLDEILAYNREFVNKEEYLPYETTKFPDKKMVIVSCMDTRLVELLPKAMNIANGDVKIIKTAGAIVNHPFGGVMRSIIVAIHALGAREVFIDTDKETCISRLLSCEDGRDIKEWTRYIDDWWSQYSGGY